MEFFACSGSRAMASEPFFLKIHQLPCSAVILLMNRGQLLWGYWQSVVCWNQSLFAQDRVTAWLYLICALYSLRSFQGPGYNCFGEWSLQRVGFSNFVLSAEAEILPSHSEKMKKARGKESIWSPCLCGCCLCPILLFRWPHESITHSYWGYNFCFDFPFLFSMQCFPLNSVTDPNWRQCGGPVSFCVATAVCFELWPSRCYVAPLDSSDSCNLLKLCIPGYCSMT